MNTHAIGDRANRTVLEAYAAVLHGKNDKRFRIEHAQIVEPADVKLFAENSVIASIQSTHATSDMRWAEARLGQDASRRRMAGADVSEGGRARSRTARTFPSSRRTRCSDSMPP